MFTSSFGQDCIASLSLQAWKTKKINMWLLSFSAGARTWVCGRVGKSCTVSATAARWILGTIAHHCASLQEFFFKAMCTTKQKMPSPLFLWFISLPRKWPNARFHNAYWHSSSPFYWSCEASIQRKLGLLGASTPVPSESLESIWLGVQPWHVWPIRRPVRMFSKRLTLPFCRHSCL